jgi:hypothetical protein
VIKIEKKKQKMDEDNWAMLKLKKSNGELKRRKNFRHDFCFICNRVFF